MILQSNLLYTACLWPDDRKKITVQVLHLSHMYMGVIYVIVFL